MPLILGTNSIKDTGYDVANSVRFDGTSSYMSFAPGSNMNLDRWTWSCWVKRAKLGAVQTIFNCDNAASDLTELQFDANDKLHFDNRVTGASKGKRVTTRVFRDVSAWYHIMVVWDSGNSTANDRIKIYVNGVQETAFDTTDNPDQNTDSSFGESGQPIRIGVLDESSEFFSGYICEAVVLDGTAAAVTDFGEFDSDSPTIWKPIDVSGLTFGSQGFYLDFENSGSLGADVSGNSNNFTVNNLTSVDQSLDTCTNNFATMNPLDNYYTSSTFSEGNLKVVTPTGTTTWNTGTFGLSSGKWYWEVNYSAKSNTNAAMIGIAEAPTTSASTVLGKDASIVNISYYTNGRIYNTNSDSAYGATYDAGDVIGVYLDLDNNKLYFSKNGTLQNSGTGVSITAPASTGTGVYFPAIGDFGTPTTTSITFELNFGSPSYAISSSNTDDNGYGNFEYSPNITGDGAAKKFYTINTKNLAEFG